MEVLSGSKQGAVSFILLIIVASVAGGAAAFFVSRSQFPNLLEDETILGDWVNTQHPWSDAEVANNLTIDEGIISNSRITIDPDSLILASAGLVSSLNADLLNGQHGSFYLAWNNLTGTPNVISSLDGVINNGGNIDLITSGAVAITPDDIANTITLSLSTLGASNISDIYLLNTGDTATGNYTFDSGTLFINSVNNRIGIGTTDPAYKLDIVGALRFQPSSAPTGANGVIYYNSSTNKFRCYQNGAWADCIGAGGGGEGYWTLSGTDLYPSDTSWNVGIGATSSVTKLQVAGDVTIDEQLALSGASINNNYAININVTSDGRGINQVITPDTGTYDTTALYNTFTLTDDMEAYGLYNDISITNGATIYGVYNIATLSGSYPSFYGSSNSTSSSGTNANIYGDSNSFSLSGSNSYVYGQDNSISLSTGATNSQAYGVRNSIQSNETGTWSYGIYNNISSLEDASGATDYGVYNSITTSGNNSTVYGTYSFLYGYPGTAQTLYGEYIELGTTSGNTGYGLYVTDYDFGLSAGTLYGVYIDLDDATTTNWHEFFANTTVNIGVSNTGTIYWKDASGNSLMSLTDVGTTGNLTLSGNLVVNGNTTIGGGTAISKHLSASASINITSVAVQSCANTSFTVTNAVAGDTVVATPTPVTGGIETLNLSWNAYVSATSTVQIRACNPSSSAQDPASQTWRVDVWQH